MVSCRSWPGWWGRRSAVRPSPRAIAGKMMTDTAKTAQLLRPIRPRDAARQTLRRLAVDLIAEIRHLDRRIATANTQIADQVRARSNRQDLWMSVSHAARWPPPC